MNKNLLDILQLFVSLRRLIDGTGGEATSVSWSDAINGRFCIEMGPENARPFVTVRIGWSFLKLVWETELNWAAIGSIDIEAALPYADVLKRLADLAPEIKRLITDADVKMEGREEGLRTLWRLARQEAGEDAEPDEVACRALQTLFEACNTVHPIPSLTVAQSDNCAPSSREQRKPAGKTKARQGEPARRTMPKPRRAGQGETARKPKPKPRRGTAG